MSLASDATQKVFGHGAVAHTLAEDDAVVVDARGMKALTVITDTGATATVSRVDTSGATAHTTGTENSFDVTANTKTATEIDWPFYRISVVGGDCRYALL